MLAPQFVQLCDLWSVIHFFFFLESWIERCLNESESKRYSSHTSLGNMSNDERKQDELCYTETTSVSTEESSELLFCVSWTPFIHLMLHV